MIFSFWVSAGVRLMGIDSHRGFGPSATLSRAMIHDRQIVIDDCRADMYSNSARMQMQMQMPGGNEETSHCLGGMDLRRMECEIFVRMVPVGPSETKPDEAAAEESSILYLQNGGEEKGKEYKYT